MKNKINSDDIEIEKKEDKKKSLWEKIFKTNKIKRNKVAVLYLRNNGSAESHEIESKEGFFTLYKKTYHEDRDCIYTLKIKKERYPLAIIPEWSLIPYGTKKWHDQAMLEKFAQYQDHVLRGIKNSELVRMGDRDKPQWNNKTIVVIGIIVIIAIGFLMGS